MAEVMKNVEEIAKKEMLADLGVERGLDWKGYETYLPNYSKEITIGPCVILVKDEEARAATFEEAEEYYDFEYREGIAKSTTESLKKNQAFELNKK